MSSRMSPSSLTPHSTCEKVSPVSRGTVRGVALSLMLLFMTACGLFSSPTSGSPHHAQVVQGYVPPPSQPTGNPSTPPVPPPTVVEGCTSVFGLFCISSVPVIACCSAAETSWSHIYVGETVPVQGSVQFNSQTKVPVYRDVTITGPGGWTTEIPTDMGGTFDEEITFPTEGSYQIGIAGQSPPVTFYVPYVPHPDPALTLSTVFPDSQRNDFGDTVLTVPSNGPTTFQVLFTDFQGNPVANRTFGPDSNITTNSAGMASFTYTPAPTVGLGIAHLYGSLFVIPYWTMAVSGGQITSWPPAFGNSPVPATVRTLSQNGTVYVDVSDALKRLDPVGFYKAYPSDAPVTFDVSTGILTLQPNTYEPVTVQTSTGQISLETCADQNCQTFNHTPEGTVTPVLSGGEVYLDLPDLVTLLNTFAWATLTPDGHLLVTDLLIP